jgi:hypothetical protein
MEDGSVQTTPQDAEAASFVLSSAQARAILTAHAADATTVAVSLDLSLTTDEVAIEPTRALLPGGWWTDHSRPADLRPRGETIFRRVLPRALPHPPARRATLPLHR